MKVYITQPYGRTRDYKNIIKLLDKKGIRRVDSTLCDSYEEASHELESCDAYMTFANDPFMVMSNSADAELEYAVRLDKPVIVIKEFEDQTCIGNGLFARRVLEFENVAMFDISAGANIKQLPDFIADQIENQRNSSRYGSASGEVRPDKPYEGDKPHIFISYAHKDMQKVFDIIRELQDRSYRVWYDEGIDPASEWDENIAEHISKCSYFIAFISPNYISSQNCKDEISYARDLNKDRLLVYLEDTKLPAGMAMRLMRLQAIHKYKYRISSDFYDKLFAAQGIGVARD